MESRRHRHLDAGGPDDALLAERDQPRAAAARHALVHTVEVDEEDALAIAVRMRHAGAQPAGHEGEMRVGVARLDGPLLGVEVVAFVQAVVMVAGTLREDGPERVDVGRNVRGTESRCQPSVKEPRRGMERPVLTMRVRRQRIVFLCEGGSEVDNVDAGPRRELEGQVERFSSGHQGMGVRLRDT
jgi:hypothetical protein